MLYIKKFKQALSHRLVLKKVHRVIKFDQQAWLKPCINMSSELRKSAKNHFEKEFFNLMKMYGRCMEKLCKM